MQEHQEGKAQQAQHHCCSSITWGNTTLGVVPTCQPAQGH
jgi:hypothetical protein